MKTLRFMLLGLICLAATLVQATPEFVEHIPANQVFGEASGTTMRSPSVPRDGDAVTLWVKIGYSFYYSDVAIYYTTNGTFPGGSRGVGSGATQVVRPTFVRNEGSGGGNQDWWKVTLPAGTREAGQVINYRIGAWASGGGPEIFSNNYGCSGGGCSNLPTDYQYLVKAAWPGAGAGSPNPQVGYPPVSFWKEEAMVGNNYGAAMVDQNGTLYDVYFPTPGGVNGVGTKNEGYVGGLDTFPPGLPLGNRGQMHLNQAMAGLRVDGTTYWLSNQNGVGYSNVSQGYQGDSNTVAGSTTLTGKDLTVQQYDFMPAGITFPNDLGGTPQRGMFVKRYLVTNTGSSTRRATFYYYADWAINGGDNFDDVYWDNTRKVMVARDITPRQAAASGEYNPTTFSDYTKNVSVYFATTMKVLGSVGGSSGATATDNWRETSNDAGQGWMASTINIAAGATVEVDVLVAGGFDSFGNATGTYDFQLAPVVDWFMANSMNSVQNATNTYWQNWLASGTTMEVPSAPTYTNLFKRGLLGTMIHFDAKNGGVVAGYHNGAYPYVWPRDAAYAAVTLARAGHSFESSEVLRWLREVTYRANETWGGKGFWYQKYTTDGYIIWSAPQVDETSVVPWAVRYQYEVTGEGSVLSQNWPMVRDAGFASSQDSSIDSRLFFDDPNNLMNSMNVWEDSFDDFLYSNANVYKGLVDAAWIAGTQGAVTDQSTFNGRAASILGGINGRLDWNGENTDISQLGLIYPFNVLTASNPKMVKIFNRMNGTEGDRWGNIKPLVRTSGEWNGLVDRYFGDTYWNGGPWFLSTMWYGLAQMERADEVAGFTDVDGHKTKLDLLIQRLGPAGFGAEQIAPNNSELYSGFKLQAAWPNAWESMSTFVDSLMAFLDYRPDAAGNTLRISPKLPSAWPTATFRNVRLGQHRMNVKVANSASTLTVEVQNITGNAVNAEIYFKLPSGFKLGQAFINDNPVSATTSVNGTRVRVAGAIGTGAGSVTRFSVRKSVTTPRF
ncbi:MAG: hypothetical protein JNJ45_01135 [Chthonomonas sp.]|nr:hypothetical protein [Chthonomonas sp.]